MRSQESVPPQTSVFTTVAVHLMLLFAATSAQAAGRASGPQEQRPKAPTTEPHRPATVAPGAREPKLAVPSPGPITGPEKGTLLWCSLDSPEIRAEFLKLAGGADAQIVMVVKQVPAGITPADAGTRAAKAWGVRGVTFWPLTDRRSAEDKAFLAALGGATGVWISGGRPTDYLDRLLDSSAHRELAALLARDGVIGGESAGAVVQSSFVALPPGAPYAGPALEGLGFARNLVVFPHFGASGKFPREACERVIAVHVGLAGLALPDGSAVVIHGQNVRVIGKAEVSLLWRSDDGSVSTTTHDERGSRFTLPDRAATTQEARPK